LDLDLAGKVVLVTGGASGIGAATAARIVREGGSVLACGRREEALREFAAQFSEPERDRVRTFAVDILDEDRLRECADFVDREFGRLDGLVAAAGSGVVGDALGTANDVWAQQFQVKVVGLLNTLRAVASALARAGDARVVVNGVSAHTPDPAMAAVSACRAAEASLVTSVAPQLAAQGIGIVSVNPGMILTDRQKARHAQLSDLLFDDWVAAEVARRRIALGRPGTADDVAAIVCFLLSPLAGYATGTSIDVAGGIGSAIVTP
jgi:NAD(P)-dependent dehydrogenase (short-subunit alcohol dehydrogenase family)